MFTMKNKRDLFVKMLSGVAAKNIGKHNDDAPAFLADELTVVAKNNSQEHLVFFSFGEVKFKADVSRVDQGIVRLYVFEKHVWVDQLVENADFGIGLFEELAKEFAELGMDCVTTAC